MDFNKIIHTKDSPADHNYANNLEDRIALMFSLINDYPVEFYQEGRVGYIKFSKGLLVQWRAGSINDLPASGTTKGEFGFYESKFYLPDYPIRFVGNSPTVLTSFGAGKTSSIVTGEYEASTIGPGRYTAHIGASGYSSSLTYSYFAIGRWKV